MSSNAPPPGWQPPPGAPPYPPYPPAPQQMQPHMGMQMQPPAMVGPPPLTWRLHSGARTALNIAAVLLCFLIVTIPMAIWIFVRVSGGRVDIGGGKLVARNLFSKTWDLSRIRRLGVMSMPIYARGIGGMLARKKVGGPNAIHLCMIDDRGKSSSFIASMYERYEEIINQVSLMTRVPVEEVKSGLLGAKWPERHA